MWESRFPFLPFTASRPLGGTLRFGLDAERTARSIKQNARTGGTAGRLEIRIRKFVVYSLFFY